jgi:hypothetical protein
MQARARALEAAECLCQQNRQRHVQARARALEARAMEEMVALCQQSRQRHMQARTLDARAMKEMVGVVKRLPRRCRKQRPRSQGQQGQKTIQLLVSV